VIAIVVDSLGSLQPFNQAYYPISFRCPFLFFKRLNLFLKVDYELLFLINFQFQVRYLRLKHVLLLLRFDFIGSFVRKMVVVFDLRLFIIRLNFIFFWLKLPLEFEVLSFTSTRCFFDFGVVKVSDLLH
jgi:hypothetical protein